MMGKQAPDDIKKRQEESKGCRPYGHLKFAEGGMPTMLAFTFCNVRIKPVRLKD